MNNSYISRGKLTKSSKIYIVLVAILAVFSAMNIFLPQGDFLPQAELPASKPVMALATFFMMAVLYGGLGFAGLLLADKLGFASLWDDKVTNNQRFLLPVCFGAGIGIFFIFADLLFQKWHRLGSLPHPPFPTSIVASLNAAIGEEIIFRLFFISFWIWLISFLLLNNRWQNLIFWIIAVFSALVFAIGHVPSVYLMLGFESINDFPAGLLAEMILLNGLLSLIAAYYFRKFGFLAAAGIHFWTDIVWHVIYGVF